MHACLRGSDIGSLLRDTHVFVVQAFQEHLHREIAKERIFRLPGGLREDIFKQMSSGVTSGK